MGQSDGRGGYVKKIARREVTRQLDASHPAGARARSRRHEQAVMKNERMRQGTYLRVEALEGPKRVMR